MWYVRLMWGGMQGRKEPYDWGMQANAVKRDQEMGRRDKDKKKRGRKLTVECP